MRGWKCVYWTVTELSSFLKVIYLSAPVPSFHTFTFRLELHLNPESVLGSRWWIAMDLHEAILITSFQPNDAALCGDKTNKNHKWLDNYSIWPFGAHTGELIQFQKQTPLTETAGLILSTFYLTFMTFCLGIACCLLNSLTPWKQRQPIRVCTRDSDQTTETKGENDSASSCGFGDQGRAPHPRTEKKKENNAKEERALYWHDKAWQDKSKAKSNWWQMGEGTSRKKG